VTHTLQATEAPARGAKLNLTLACGLYDRTVALQNGTITADGIDLNFLAMGPGQLFRRQARHAEFDVAEFSMSTYCLLRARGDERMVAIPVFPSRKFRHTDIYVNAHSGIDRPDDLAGKRVGTQEYQQTAAIWIRGILEHEHNVPPSAIHWFFGGYNEAERFTERIPLKLPANVQSTTIGEDRSLDQMLEAGDIDALMGATAPRSFDRGSPNVRRLFPNSRQVEADYFRRTGIFPIMHLVVLRRDVYERAPWIATNLLLAFEQAKHVGLDRLRQSGTLFCALPWLIDEIQETERLLGRDPFAYGLTPQNRHVLDTFLTYWYEQGLADRQLRIEDLFVPEVL
jgi:4,5-dihydroxyphthalate decarboxylase